MGKKKKFRDSRLDRLPGKSDLGEKGKFRDSRADQLKGPKIAVMDELDVKRSSSLDKKSGLADRRSLTGESGPIWEKHDMESITILGSDGTSKVEEHLEGIGREEPDTSEENKEKGKIFETLSGKIRKFGKTAENEE